MLISCQFVQLKSRLMALMVTFNKLTHLKSTKTVPKISMHFCPPQMKYRDGVATLVITDIEDSDAGRYTCEAQNQYGYISTTAAVKVKAPPRLEFDSRYLDQQFPTGATIKITVSVDGEPTPTTTWTREGLSLKVYSDL